MVCRTGVQIKREEIEIEIKMMNATRIAVLHEINEIKRRIERLVDLVNEMHVLHATAATCGAGDEPSDDQIAGDIDQTKKGSTDVSQIAHYKELINTRYSTLDCELGQVGGSRGEEDKRECEPLANALLHATKPDREPEEFALVPSAPKKRTNGSRLRQDWSPTKEMIQFARSAGYSPERIQFTADSFRDYWLSKAGKDAVKLDWDATWRNWLRRDMTGARLDARWRHRASPKSESILDEALRAYANRAKVG